MNNLVKRAWPLIVIVLFNLIITPAAYCESVEIKLLRLGVREDAPPFSFRRTENTDFRGYSVDLCRQIAYRAIANGKYDKFEFVKVTSNNRFDALRNQDVNILCEATTVTLKRIRDFSQTLYTFLSGASFMYPDPIIQTSAHRPLRIGVLNGTTTKTHLSDTIWPRMKIDLENLGFNNIEDFNLVETNNHWEYDQYFREKKIDIYIADREILIALNRISANEKYRVSSGYYSIEPYALFTRREDVELLNIANTTLRDLYRETKDAENIKEILKKNFPNQIFSSTLLQLFRLQCLLD
jgi:polar amino acid transport system substrate-binding protein